MQDERGARGSAGRSPQSAGQAVIIGRSQKRKEGLSWLICHLGADSRSMGVEEGAEAQLLRRVREDVVDSDKRPAWLGGTAGDCAESGWTREAQLQGASVEQCPRVNGGWLMVEQ
uniref:Uncharacterized protein n=1 Tax=Oryza sativa subsp. japonica TaxID=39947 RepID=Q6K9G2_ORYSJ|nr:hypothetical protein [Oryza sativa Japonica Group]BAD21573.1 hypothetical protein [Oryza sativa Japonica Group]